MNKLASCIVIGIVVLGGLGAVVTATNKNQINTKKSNTNLSTYVDELDHSMTIMMDHCP